MSLQIELLEKSFNYIKPYGNLFVSSFYDNLFKTNPEVQSLFTKINPEIRKNKFWESLILAMESLRQPDVFKNILQGFGARLFTDGVLSKHYPLVRDAFLATFAQFLGDEWTTEFEQAWKDAYVRFRELMLEGAEQASKQIISKHPVIETEQASKQIISKHPLVETAQASKQITSRNSVIEVERAHKKITSKNSVIEAAQAHEQIATQNIVVESDNNIPQKNNSPITPIALSESQTMTIPKASATVSNVESEISKQIEQQENQASKSNTIFFLGGGIAGVIGLLLLIILL